jgi:hypothetical protein
METLSGLWGQLLNSGSKRDFAKKKKSSIRSLSWVGRCCVHLFSPKPPAFSKKKSTTCSSFSFPVFSVPSAGTLLFLLLCLYASLFDRECNKCCRFPYHISHLACHSQNIAATNSSVYIVCLFLVFRDLFVFTQFTQY